MLQANLSFIQELLCYDERSHKKCLSYKRNKQLRFFPFMKQNIFVASIACFFGFFFICEAHLNARGKSNDASAA